MAKNNKSKGKVEKEIGGVNNGIKGIFSQYDSPNKKEKKSLVKKTNKKYKDSVKRQKKTNAPQETFIQKGLEILGKKLGNEDGRITIEYGIGKFNVKQKWFESLKDPEKWLNHQFSRQVEGWINNAVLETKNDARALEGLIAQYSKKSKGTDFYNPYVVENSINKLTNFRGKLNDYDYNEYIKAKKNVIEKELDDYDSGREIGDYYEEETGESEEKYDPIEKPILVNGFLVGLQINFF